VPLKRPPIAVQLVVAATFGRQLIRSWDHWVILERRASALYDPALLPYKFLIVGHTDATGKREYNLALSQRRADSIRDVLVTTFKISSKRLQAIGLGEEQLLDAAHPTAAINQRMQIATVGKVL
jgi:outer membrane protein OmpA-like peptidoglycan-associated protein